jgi:hypothetical protein
MQLDDKWLWQGRKLTCRVNPESGNPAGDDLRARFVELAGKDLEEMGKMYDTLGMMKETKKRKETEKKGVHIDHKADKKFHQVLSRKHILGATELALEKMHEKEEFQEHTVTQKNLKKQFNRLPVSPPSRVLLEIQRERSKPPTTVDTEDLAAKQAKLEKKLEKQRIKRMAAMKATEASAEHKEKSMKFSQEVMKNTFKAQEFGDLFGTHDDYMQSMLYMSRMAGNLEKSERVNNHKSDIGTTAFDLEKDETEKVNKEVKDKDATDDNSNNSQTATDLNQKLYCVISLCNWARNPNNAVRLAQEGGVRAIIQLVTEQDTRILKYSSAAFRFMSEIPALASVMIDDGAVSVISDVVKVPIDEFASTNLAVALVNLTRINGKEAYLVESSIVLALQNIMANRPELSALCARGLYNLTCVDGMYPLMERLIRTIISISSSSVSSVRHICVAALCNLSDLKLMRARLVEEGTISVLGSVARHAPTRTRRVCAVIMQNLSATKNCRVEMVLRSSVHVAHSLSSDKDPIILRCVGLTLARLSTEGANSVRIIQEFGVNALCNIAMKFPTVAGITQPVSTAFQLLASQPSVRVQVVSNGCVTSIAQLLHSSKDSFTLQNSLYALCNLLVEPENHLPIVQQGLILTIIDMATSDDDLIRDLCALALFNLSRAEDSRKHVVNAGAVTSLIQLASQNEAVTKQRCAHALCNVCTYEQGVPRMVADGIIPALVMLLREDSVTIHYACAALSQLCSSLENSVLIAESGGIPSLVEGTLNGDMTTKQFCGAVISAMSVHDTCKVTLCDSGAIGALKSLADLFDDSSKQRCLVAFANMSTEESVRSRMVQEGVVSVIAGLIGNSYQEKNYICCAKALCNLACAPATRLQVAQEGGVHTLLMISMVHSVDRQTKLLCVNALYNLLDENTVNYMVEEGITTSVANLCRLDDSRVLQLCARMINYLTKFSGAMTTLMERTSLTYSAISKMLESVNANTKMIAARTTANLALAEDVMVSSAIIDGGGLDVLCKGAMLEGVPEASMQCIAALFLACREERFLATMGQLQVGASMVQLGLSGVNQDETKNVLISKITATLALNKSSRRFLHADNSSFAPDLVALIKANTSTECGVWLGQALRFYCDGAPEPYALVEEGIGSALVALSKLGDKTSVISSSVVEVARLLVEGDVRAIPELAQPAILCILLQAIKQQVVGKANDVLYNVAVVMNIMASGSTEARQSMVSCDECQQVMLHLIKHRYTSELATATMFAFFNDAKSRTAMCSPEIGAAIVAVMKESPHKDTLYNCVSALFVMSKYPESRSYLASDPINADQLLLQMKADDDPKLKANISRAVKNLQSDINEAIEEGVVASLIAISLEGKQQKTKVTEDVRHIEVHPFATAAITDVGFDKFDGLAYFWYCEKEVSGGGEVGAGPPHPSPPHMGDSEGTYKQFGVEELDGNNGEQEGKAKMGFAKMQIPAETKAMFLLNDADFVIKEDGDGSATDDASNDGLGGAESSVIPGGAMEDSMVMGQTGGDAIGGDNMMAGSMMASADVMPATGSLEEGSLAAASADNEYNDDADFETDPAEEEKAGSEAETAAKAKKAPARMPLGQDKGSKDVSAKAAELGLYQ